MFGLQYPSPGERVEVTLPWVVRRASPPGAAANKVANCQLVAFGPGHWRPRRAIPLGAAAGEYVRTVVVRRRISAPFGGPRRRE